MANYGLIWHEWFNDDQRENLEQEFKNIIGLLRRGGVIKLVARKWLREQIAKREELTKLNEKDIREIKNRWAKEKLRSENIEMGENEWTELRKKNYISEKELETYCEFEIKAMNWARRQWSNSVQQLYLEKKEQFDYGLVSYVTAPKEQKRLMNEIYFAIKNKEYEIDDACKQYPEQIKGTNGKPMKIKIGSMKPAMKYHVTSAKIEKPTAPFESENRLIILKVHEYKRSALSEEMKEELIRQNLNEFVGYGVEEILKYLCRNDDAEAM